MLHYGQVETKTCLKIVLDPDPSSPISKSFWTLFCSRYSGTNLPESPVACPLKPWEYPGGIGREKRLAIRRVDAWLRKKKYSYLVDLHADFEATF